MFKLGLLSLLGGVVSAVVAILVNSLPAAVLAIGLWLFAIEVTLLAKAAGGFSATVLPVLSVSGACLSALLFWNQIRAEAIVSIRFRVSDEYLIQGALIGIVFCAAFTVGALLAGPRGIRMSKATVQESISELGSSLPISDGALLAVGYGGIAVAGYAWQGALLEGRYLSANGPTWAVSVAILLTPISIVCLCIVAAKPGPLRGLAILGVALWVGLLFARSSRSLALIPIMLFSGAALAGRKTSLSAVALTGVTTVFLLQLSLVGRVNPKGVGLIPLSDQLFARFGEAASEISPYALLGNIIIAGPQAAVVANRPITAEAFWVSINPLPGGLAGWPEIGPSLRFTKSMPYNALGELGSHGWILLVAVAGLAGFVLALSTRLASSLTGAAATIAALLVLGCAVFFSLSVLQYNLRSSMRIAYYALLGVGAIWFAQVYSAGERPRLPLTKVARGSERR